MTNSLIDRTRQKGAVAIIVALLFPVLLGFAGIALDVGRLYIEKTELQNAADACALAAAFELTCDVSAGPCTTSYLVNAENSGRAVAARNKVNFQSAAIDIPPADIKFSTTFSPESSYLSRADGASPASKYVMCTSQQTGIGPWFMRVLGVGDSTVRANAVATLSPAQANCAIPIGMCKLPAGTPADPFAGMVVGQWMTSKLSSSATGSFGWIDFTPPGGGANELANLLTGSGACAVPPSPTQVGEQGNITSLGTAWNTRFGLYKGSENATTAPPDFTGIAYTPTSWPAKFNAYAGSPGAGSTPNFQTARAQRLPYQGDTASGMNIPNSYRNSTSAELATSATDRRLATVPVVDCSSWTGTSPQTVPILGYACALMLHPMDKDNGPSGSDEVWIEFRGRSTDPLSPCATSGSVGGPGSVGPLVPALVQ